MDRASHTRLAFLFIIFLASTAAAQQTVPDAKPAQSRMISGRVVSESGQPLAGANVFAGMPGTSSSQRTSTDSEGYFKLQGLDAGLYRVSANLPGYVFQPGDPDFNSPNAFYRPGDSVSLTLVKGGVIAGIVSNVEGQPVVNVSVRAMRVRDAEGARLRTIGFAQPRLTDDRGYYRIYGLAPGTYVVSAGGQGQYFGAVNPYAKDAPTYAPASTRDTAAEIFVRSDQEVTVNITYRGEPGHAVSGKVSGVLPATAPPSGGIGVRLSDPENHAVIAGVPVNGDDRTFQINGVSEGEYEIAALAGGGPNSDLSASSPRRITVKGTDITGLELVLEPTASISGRINLEPDEKLNCGRRRDNAMREMMLVVRRDQLPEKSGTPKSTDKSEAQIDSAFFPVSVSSIPNAQGEINFRNLFPATYRFEFRLPGAGWYVRELKAGPSNQRGPAGRGSAPNLATTGIKVKAGEKIADLAIAVTEGGAGLRGRVATSEGRNLTSGLRVYLAPAERENSDNVLRFFEGPVGDDGTFSIGNLAPGGYWIIAQPAEVIDATPKSIKSDATLRAKVLHDAEAGKKEITFKPCERTLDYELPYSP